jgi:hypothetical protein
MLLELAHEERFIARTARDGKPFLLAALARNDNEKQKTTRLLPRRL